MATAVSTLAAILLVASASALTSPSFLLLERSGGRPGLELIGSRKQRHRAQEIIDEDRMQELLARARERHRELKVRVEALDDRGMHGRSDEVALLKRQRLREKDRISALLSALRRVPTRAADTWTLGAGSFGRVLLGRYASTGPANNAELVAIKVAPRDAAAPRGSKGSMLVESDVLRAVKGRRGFPRLVHHGFQSVHGVPSEVLAMELLGPSLEELWWATSGGTVLSAPCVLRLGDQLVHRLRRLHQAGYVHNDIKPGNVCMGGEGSNEEAFAFLVDFGIATRAAPEPPGGASAGADEPASDPEGSLLFASLAVHDGTPTRPCDDLESLCYTLRFLVAGALRWEHAATAAEARELKLGVEPSELGAGLEPDAAHALVGLWGEVLRARASKTGDVDYEACWAALRGAGRGGDAEPATGGDTGAAPPFDWDASGLSWNSVGQIVDAAGTSIPLWTGQAPPEDVLG